jgi:hypothetical protein
MNRRWQAYATAIRLLYGAFWLLIVIAPFLTGKGIPTQTVPAAKALWEGLEASRFLIPLLGTCYGIGGLLVLFRRTAPLGLLVLSPPLLVIVLFNALLIRSASAWVVLAPVHALLLWQCRADFRPLWNGGRNVPGA